MTSAPARTTRRTTGRTSARLLTTPSGSSGSCGTQQENPDGLTRSPIPPIGEMMHSETTSRGPAINPSSIARLNPASRPAASRTAVYPIAKVCSQDLGGAQSPGALRLVDAPAPRQIVAVHRHMVVAVDQPGQDRHTRDIDDLGILRPLAGRLWW